MKNALKSISFSILLALLALPFTSQAQSVQAEVEAFVANFGKLYNQGDAAGLATLFSKDAMMIMADNQMVTGKQDIEKYYRQFHDVMEVKGEINLGEVIPLPGEYSYISGPYTLGATVKANGQKLVLEGSYGTLLKKIDGQWKVVRQMVMAPQS